MRVLTEMLLLGLVFAVPGCDLLLSSDQEDSIPGRNVFYRGPNLNHANSVTSLSNGGLLVSGLAEGHRGPLDGLLSLPFLLRVSPDDQIADTTVYRAVRDGETLGAIPYNEGLAVLVQKQSYDQETPDLPNAVLYHTTPTGTRKSELFKRTDTFLPRQSLRRTSDEGVLIVLSPSGDRPDELVKLDAGGDVAWTYQQSGLQGAAEISGDAILVLARRDSRRYDLTRLSPDGREQWQRTYGNDTLRRAEAIAPVGDGAAVLGTRSVPKSIEEWAVVTRVDSAGAITWRREYVRGDLSATAITELPDGGVAFGYAARQRETGPARSYVVRSAPDGTIRWQRRFGPREGDTRIGTLTTRSEKTIVATGSTCSQFAPGVVCGDLLIVTYDAE